VQFLDGRRLGARLRGRVHCQAGRRRVRVMLVLRWRLRGTGGHRPGTRAGRQRGRGGRVSPDGPVKVLLVVMATAVVMMMVIRPWALWRRWWPGQRGRRSDANDAAARVIALGRDVGEFGGRRLGGRPRHTGRGHGYAHTCTLVGRRLRAVRGDHSGHRNWRFLQY